MGTKIKKLIVLGILGYVLYFLLGHHLIFFGREVEILKKGKLDFTHTFYSVGNRKDIQYKGLENMLKDEDLRSAGLGELLVSRGLITEDELRKAEDKVDYSD